MQAQFGISKKHVSLSFILLLASISFSETANAKEDMGAKNMCDSVYKVCLKRSCNRTNENGKRIPNKDCKTKCKNQKQRCVTNKILQKKSQNNNRTSQSFLP